MEELDKEPHQLLMCHFKYPDTKQDIYSTSHDEEYFQDLYKKIDNLAGRIVEKSDYDTIIFISDHGMPLDIQHNKNAFYSCNHELFGDETPHITDFHDKILEMVDSNDPELEGVDI